MDGRDEPISGFLGGIFRQILLAAKMNVMRIISGCNYFNPMIRIFPRCQLKCGQSAQIGRGCDSWFHSPVFFCFIPIKVGQFFFNWKGPPGRASGGNTRKIKKRSTTSTNNNEINYLVGGKSLRPQLSSSSEILVLFKSIRFLLCTAVGLFKYIISIPLLPLGPCVF